jgi:alanyl-tRNA synthetase
VLDFPRKTSFLAVQPEFTTQPASWNNLTVTTKRLYYDDSFAREFNAQVVRCEPVPREGGRAWAVSLDRTAFYPTSGGQPDDRGVLGAAQVLEVREEGGDIFHLLDRPIELGAVTGSIDWARRFDHMQQHTGQHLLSAIFVREFSLQTVSFHLGTDICTIDLRGREPSLEMLEAAEHAANAVVFEDRPVNVRYGTAEELAALGVRKEVQRPGILRAIEIEGADLQPCGGTHVRRTGQIGIILVRRCAKIRQDWRVEFVCGGRAARAARSDFLLLRAVSEKLSCPPEEAPSALERAIAERDSQFKSARSAWQRLAELEAASILASTSANTDGLRVVSRVFQADTSPEFAGFLAAQLSKAERTVSLFALVESGQLIFAQTSSAGRDMAALLKRVLAELGGKGGGTRDFARGKLSDPSKSQQAIDLAVTSLNA